MHIWRAIARWLGELCHQNSLPSHASCHFTASGIFCDVSSLSCVYFDNSLRICVLIDVPSGRIAHSVGCQSELFVKPVLILAMAFVLLESSSHSALEQEIASAVRFIVRFHLCYLFPQIPPPISVLYFQIVNLWILVVLYYKPETRHCKRLNPSVRHEKSVSVRGFLELLYAAARSPL